MDFDVLVRSWIAEVVQAHPQLLRIAVCQRAKFEGWLEFELAACAVAKGAVDVQVEASADDSSNSRADLTFNYKGERCDVELKTCNTNWRMKGVLDKTRPITKNVAGIIADARKLQRCPATGIVAACIFPIECGDMRWTEYLDRISAETGIQLSVNGHAIRVSTPVAQGCSADIVIISFRVGTARFAAAGPAV